MPTSSDCMLQEDEPPVRLQLLLQFSLSDQDIFLVNTMGTPPSMHNVLTGRDGQATAFLESPRCFSETQKDTSVWPLPFGSSC